MKNGKFEKTDKEWACFHDYYMILEEFYAKGDYAAMMHKLNDFMKAYGVKQVLKPQIDPVAALAHRLAIAMADLAEDLRRADK